MMAGTLRERISGLRQSAKKTRAYSTYRNSMLYDTVRRRGKVLKRAIKLPRYLGNEFQCPVCGVGLRAFRPMQRSYWRDVAKFSPIHSASRWKRSTWQRSVARAVTRSIATV